MLAALKSRQEALEETLRQRLEELKRLCLREAELTGKLPIEYPLDPGEEPPIVRRRIGTAFKLDEQKILPKGEEAELERLEREFAIQSQITEAARRLASDPNVSKKLKKQRKTSYLNALKKLQEIENAINENRIKSGKKPTQRASLVIDDGNIASEDSSLSDALVLEDEDSQVTSTLSPLQSPHKGLPPRPPSSHNRPPPPQSLEGLRQMHYHRTDYDKSPLKPKMWSESSLDEPYEKVKKRSSHSHSSSHKRFPSTGSCTEAGVSSSLQNSPIRGLPHWNSQSSMPSTPDLRVRSPHYVHSTRSVDISPTRLHSLALHFRHRSSSLESQGKLLGSENDTGSPDFYTPRTRSSNGSDPMDDCSSCTSHSSSEHYYPAQMNANYSTLAEDSPSKARQRQRQRQRAAGALGSASSGSMPNLAARSGAAGAGGGVYLHSQSQPSSQYRIKEYPLYIEGSATPVVVRSLESDQEGHYSVKAQFKTSNSYTAGGLFKESWRGGGDEGDAGRLTPSRSQILRTPSLGREGAHDKGSGRAAVSDELRQWYQRSTASHKEHSRLSHTSSTSSDSGSQYSTSSQSTFVAHSRVTRMPQMCKATSGEQSRGTVMTQRSSTPSSEIGATPPSSPHHILTWQTGSYSDSCFLDSSLYPELADVQWYGQEKAKPGTLVCLTQTHCHLHQLRPLALFFSCLHIPFTLKNLTEETFWKVPIPLCVPWLSYPKSQTTILNGTLVVSPCHDSPGQELSGKPTHAIPVEENGWKSVGREWKKERPLCADCEAASSCHHHRPLGASRGGCLMGTFSLHLRYVSCREPSAVPSTSPDPRAWKCTQWDSEDGGGLAGLADAESVCLAMKGKQAGRSALCRGLSLHLPSCFPLRIGRKLKKDLLFMYVNPRATVDSTSPGGEGPTLWLTLQWLGKLWKSSGSISTVRSIHNMRLRPPPPFSTPTQGQVPQRWARWLDDPSFQKQYSSGHTLFKELGSVRAGKGGRGTEVYDLPGLHKPSSQQSHFYSGKLGKVY
ncbi:hypothetical protein U0070_020555, partial [Myodes glareolus]